MTKKKRIAVFGVKGFPGHGGAARANESIVNHLKDKYDYTIYAVETHTNRRGTYNGYYQKVFKGFKGKRINTLLYYLKSVFHALFAGNYDLVQVNHTSSGFIVPLLRLRYKVVSTARGVIPKDDNKWNKTDKFLFDLSSYLFFRFSSYVISVSQPHIEIFKKYTKKKIDYIPNGIYLDNGVRPVDEKEDYMLFAAGRIIALKGAHTLVDALNILEYKKKTIFIGNTNHTPDYIQKLKSNSAERDIEFIGLIKEKKTLFEYIAKSKLFVFPSFNEGMSNMLLEVASLKTPLICSDIVENKAVFDENEVLFFRTGDAQDLAEKIQWAHSNYDSMQEKAERAFEKLKRDYLWEDIARKYESIYENLTK